MYNLSELMRSNYHIHTNLSSCANRDMIAQNIISYAEQAGLKTIALVDHHHGQWQNLKENITVLIDEVSNIATKLKVLIGAELSAYGIDKYSDTIEENSMVEYRLYAYNHYHLEYWEQPEVISPRAYVEHSLIVLKKLLESERADCIAHPFSGHFVDHRFNPKLICDAISDNEIGDMLKLGKSKGVLWEVNSDIMFREPELSRRYWNLGKEVGVEFRFGTDAHILADIDSMQFFSKLEAMLK